MNFARQSGGRYAAAHGQPSDPQASYGDVPAEAVKEALEAPHGQAAAILERAQLDLPEIMKVDLPDKNHTKAFWHKFDHLMKMEKDDAFSVGEKQQATWGYTIREVVKENTERKYKFVRARTGLYLKRTA